MSIETNVYLAILVVQGLITKEDAEKLERAFYKLHSTAIAPTLAGTIEQIKEKM